HPDASPAPAPATRPGPTPRSGPARSPPTGPAPAASTRTTPSRPPSMCSRGAFPGIDEGMGDVDEQVHDDEDRARPDREAHHRVVVRAEDRVNSVRTDPWPVEHTFGHDPP